VLQFCRFLPVLKRLGLARLFVVCPASLLALMKTVGGVDACVTPEGISSLPLPDCWCLMVSIPAFVGTTLDSIPASVPYLQVDERRVAAWRARLPADKPKVGIVWGGEARPWKDESATSFSRRHVDARLLVPLLELPDICFVSLQKGEFPRSQLVALPEAQRPLDMMDEVADFADTAAIIESLDLVITVDTSVAHLAGALGKPVWILLCSAACWRWLPERDDSPWYPTARLFRQTEAGVWQPVIESVAQALTAWRCHGGSLT
jgi:hypothetical protein